MLALCHAGLVFEAAWKPSVKLRRDSERHGIAILSAWRTWRTQRDAGSVPTGVAYIEYTIH